MSARLRLLLALDASERSLAALESLGELAQRLGAELAALFVEDEELLRLAALPHARELGTATGAERAVGPEAMRRGLRARAALARQACVALAERRQLAVSFRVDRGQVVATVARAASEADLLVVAGRAYATRLGGTTRALLAGSGRVLLLPSDHARAGRIGVVYDGSLAGRRALAATEAWADAAPEGLVALVPGAGAAALAEEARDAAPWAARFVAHRLHPGRADLAEAARAAGVGLLVLDAEQMPADEPSLARLIQRSSAAVLRV